MLLFIRPQITPYVILFIERDGSTYLKSLLMSHPQVEAVYERFAVLRQEGADANQQLRWARSFLARPWIGNKKAFGFKTKLVDVLDEEGFIRVLRDTGSHIIQMHRRNSVKAVVSRFNALRLYEASGKWNLYKETDQLPPIQIDLAEFDKSLREREQSDRELIEFTEKLNLPKIIVEYEDLLKNKESTLEHILTFLKIPHLPLKENTLKHTSDDLREAIQNFDELRAHYDNTPYAEMFDEVLVRQ